VDPALADAPAVSGYTMIDTRLWWYISFSDDGEFQGAIFVHGDSAELARDEAIRCGAKRCWHHLSANITGMPLPPEEARGRLLSLSEMFDFFPREVMVQISTSGDEPILLVRSVDA
jgi:hypothetical protein